MTATTVTIAFIAVIDNFDPWRAGCFGAGSEVTLAGIMGVLDSVEIFLVGWAFPQYGQKASSFPISFLQ